MERHSFIETENFMLIDRTADLTQNNNAIIIGSPESGKTFLVKQEVFSVLQNPGDQVVIVVGTQKKANEYMPLIERFGGKLMSGDVIMGCEQLTKPLTVFCCAGVSQWITVNSNLLRSNVEDNFHVTYILEMILERMSHRRKNGGNGFLWIYFEDDLYFTCIQLDKYNKIHQLARTSGTNVTSIFREYPQKYEMRRMIENTQYVFAFRMDQSSAERFAHDFSFPNSTDVISKLATAKTGDGIVSHYATHRNGYSTLSGKKILFCRR